MNTLISILIPVFNSRDFIQEAVESWLLQTHDNIEIILQDDYSTDGTWEFLVERYSSNERVLLERNNVNKGIGENWNFAYKRVKGKFVVIFNSDDTIKPRFLQEALVIFEEHPSLDFVSSSYYTGTSPDDKKETNSISQKCRGPVENILLADRDLPVKLHWNYTLIKKETLEDLKTDGELFHRTQVCDAMLWCEAYKKEKKGFFTGKISGFYRIHDQNNSKIPLGEFESTMLAMLPNYYKELRIIHPQNFLSPLLTCINYLYQGLKFRKKLKFKVIKNILYFGYKG